MRNTPSHYQQGDEIEPLVYVESHNMTFSQGNVIKYVTRYKRKGTPLQDLLKARDYLDFLIEQERGKDLSK